VSRGRQTALVVGLLTLLTAAVTWPLAQQLDSVVPDLGDPLHFSWVLAWDLHALARDPLHLFDANAFYPHRWTLAYSEHLLGLLPLAAPVWLAGGGPVLVHNVVLFASFPLVGLAMFCLVRHLTGRPGPALLSGILYAFCHYRFGHLAHVQLLSHYWLPLMLLGLHRAVTGNGRWPAVALAVGAFVAQTLTAGTHGGLAGVAGLLFVLWVAGPADRPPLARPAFRAALAAAVGALVLAPVLLPYYVLQRKLGLVRGLAELEGYSAVLQAYLTLPRIHPWFELLGAQFHRSEGALFPGVVLPSLAILGALAGLRRPGSPTPPPVEPCRSAWPRWLEAVLVVALVWTAVHILFVGGFVVWLGPLRVSHRRMGPVLVVLALALLARRLVHRGPVPLPGLAWVRALGWPNVPGYYVALVAIGVLASLGPTFHLTDTLVVAPLYHQLYELVPGFGAFRVPARFVVLALTGLAVLAGYGAAALVEPWRARRRVAALVALALLALLEVWAVPLPFYGASDLPGDVDRWLARAPSPGPVLILPLISEPDAWGEAARLVGSTAHWRPLVNGYASYYPPGYWDTVERLNAFPAPEAVAHLRALGVRYVVVQLDQLRDDARARVEAVLPALPPGLTRVATFDETVVLEVRPAGATASGEAGGPNEGAGGAQDPGLHQRRAFQAVEAGRDRQHGVEAIAALGQPLPPALLPVDEHDQVLHDEARRLQGVDRLQLARAVGHDVVDHHDALAGLEHPLDTALGPVTLLLAAGIDEGHAAGQAGRHGQRQAGVGDAGHPVAAAARDLRRQEAPDVGQHRRVADHHAQVDVEGRGDARLQDELAEADGADLEQAAHERGVIGGRAHAPSSRTMASTAATGSGAAVIGRPTTR
jgi:hypothetical protein